MLITRTSVLTGLVVGTIALTACSSSSKTNTASSPSSAGGTSSSPTTANSSSAPATNVACGKGTLNADGSTAQNNAMQQWTKDYQGKCSGTTINYSGGGSGQGITDFKSGKVDFAGSDSALDATKGEIAAAGTRCGGTALDLPMVVGPIAVAFNIKGVSALTLTPQQVTQIFLGKITKWDDPALKSAGSNLPSTAITVFYRSDQSGTTQNFEKYLAANDAADYGTGKPSKVWSGKVGQGKTGSQGVAQGISSTDGAIGYDEFSYAVNGNLATAKIDNGGGPVELTGDTAAAAAGAAKVVGTGDDLSLKLDYATKAAGAYPIILVTYEIVCTKYADSAKGSAVKAFMSYISGDGQMALKDLGYAPLPSALQTKVQASIAKIS